MADARPSATLFRVNRDTIRKLHEQDLPSFQGELKDCFCRALAIPLHSRLTRYGAQASLLRHLKFAKIQFETREARLRAVEGLMHRAKVVALRGSCFIVPEPALEWLAAQGIPYIMLESLNQDDVLHTLRNTPAHPV